MGKRHDKLGIKQTIQLHWMDYVVKVMLAGLSEKEIRNELDEYLATEKPYTGKVPNTHAFIKSMLSAWFAPEKELISFRDRTLALIKEEPSQNWLPYHFAILSAAYPFWFNVAKQTGRLFNLQEQITSKQISVRLCEHYGERESVWHYGKYVVRSFVVWGLLQDSKEKGCYEKGTLWEINNKSLAMLIFEAALHADKDGKAPLEVIKNNPAFFPFRLPSLTGDYIIQHAETLDVVRYGLDDELLKLR